MRSKKNPKADLNKKSSFYFAIGLFIVLFVSWRAIEYKNYDDDGYGYIALNVDDEDDEERNVDTSPNDEQNCPECDVGKLILDDGKYICGTCGLIKDA
jgi:ribosomal protein S27AE